MPRSISKFVMGAVAIGVAVVGASAIGIAAAQSSHEQAKTTTHRIMATVLKTEFRIGDHQQAKHLPARQCDCRHGGAADRARG